MRRILAVIAALMLATPVTAKPLRLYLERVEQSTDAQGMPVITYTATPESAQDFAQFTAERVGQTIDVMVDGKVVVTPRIMDVLLGGHGQFPLPQDAPQEMIQRLRDGSAVLEVRDHIPAPERP